jgi:selenocysteine lyase/cysteine desulfurase
MSTRREFIEKMSLAFVGAAIATPLLSFSPSTRKNLELLLSELPNAAVDNEDFWGFVKQAYSSSGALLNLNNGGVSPQPKVVQESFIEYYKLFNQAPSYYMWRIMGREIEAVRDKVARFSGVSAEEIAFNRNTTEALDTIITGLDFEKGDEVVISNFDYPNMRQAWDQRSLRDKIQLRIVNHQFPSDDADALVNAYVEQFNSKTKVVLITHIINWTGQVLPVKRIVAEAKKRGIITIVDAAHSFAHLDYKISDFDADYLGTSLHKWLCAPFGAGMVHMKKERIPNTWASFAPLPQLKEDIRKFENLGTRNTAVELSIGKALDFHNMIGSKRKEDRLLFLRNYWMDKAKNIKGFRSFSPEKRELSCALATVNIDGVEKLGGLLQNDYNIHTTDIVHEGVNGVRITPNVYTSLGDLDRLVDALNKIAANRSAGN